MKTKLPEGVPVYIFFDGDLEGDRITPKVYTLTDDEKESGVSPDGLAMTYKQLAERDKAIARAAYFQGELYQQSHAESMAIDDYLESEEFKKLVGE